MPKRNSMTLAATSKAVSKPFTLLSKSLIQTALKERFIVWSSAYLSLRRLKNILFKSGPSTSLQQS